MPRGADIETGGAPRQNSYAAQQERQKQAAAASAANVAAQQQQAQQLALQEQAKKDAEAQKQAAIQAEASKFLQIGKMTPEQEANMAALKGQSEGTESRALAMSKIMQDRAARQQMALAYSRGYNPGAVRGAQYATAEAQAGIAAEAEQARQQEQVQARQLYTQALEYKQKMAMASQDAYNAFLAGKTQEAYQMQKMAQDYELGLKGVQTQQQAIAEQASASSRGFWGSVLGGVLTAGGAIGGAMIGGPAGAVAGGSAGSAIAGSMRR